MAGVAARMTLEVVLVVALRVCEAAGLDDLSDQGPLPASGLIDLRDHLSGGLSLVFGGVEDRRAVLAPRVGALSVELSRVMGY